VRVLNRAGLRGPLRLIVFEAMYTAEQRSCFGSELAKLVAQGTPLPGWVSDLHVIDPTSFLTASDYYPLDEHLNADGYRKIAGAIAPLIAR